MLIFKCSQVQNVKQLFVINTMASLNFSVASAILQSAVFGVVGRFPSCYIAGTVSGQALGGIMAAVAEIVSLWVGASPILSALVYFIMADVFIVISVLAYMFLASTVSHFHALDLLYQLKWQDFCILSFFYFRCFSNFIAKRLQGRVQFSMNLYLVRKITLLSEKFLTLVSLKK